MRGRVARLLLGLVLADRPADLERLADVVWGESPPPTHRSALHVHLGTLRRQLAVLAPGATVERVGEGYRLRLDGWETDLQLVTDLVESARAALARDPRKARDLLDRALGLWRGTPFAVDGEVVDEAAFHLAESARRDAEELFVEALLALGDAAAAEAAAHRFVTREPLREARWGQLLRARYLAGRTADALGTYRDARATLVEQLGIEPGRDLRDLEAAVLIDDRARLHLPTSEDQSTLPAPPRPARPLVCRDEEVNRLVRRLSRGEPLLVIGPPGVGKTRLATEAVRTMGLDAAWIDVRDPGHVEAVGAVPEWSRRHPDGVVVFDNAETDPASVADSVAGLRRHAPTVAIVVTSRVPIEIDAGVEVVSPLAQPSSGDDELRVEQSPAARVLRAALDELAPAASVSSRDVERLCERAGGLPLVLRLLASAARALPVEMLLDPSMTVAGDEVVAAVQSTSALLSDQEREAFMDLSVIGGDFDHDLAAGVTGLGADRLGAVLRQLVDHGLVQAQPDCPLPFTLLEPIREAAGRLLDRSGRGPATFDRHIDACLLRARALDRLAAIGVADLRQRIAAELPRLREVVSHLAEVGDAERALALVCRLERPLYSLGWWSEKVELFDTALAIKGPDSAMRARAHAFRSRPGPLHLLEPAHAERAEAMAAALGEHLLAAYARHHRAIALWWSGDLQRSIELSEDASRAFHDAGRAFEWTEARKFLGVAMVFAGDVRAGMEVQRDALASVRRAGDAPIHVAHHLAYLGHCHRMLGDDAAAFADLSEARQLCLTVGNRGTAIHIALALGELAVERGEPATALSLTSEALELISASRGWVYEPWAWTVAVRAHTLGGDLDTALSCGRRALVQLPRVPSGEGVRLAGELAALAVGRGDVATAARLLAVARAIDDVREMPFRPHAEAARLADLEREVAAAGGVLPTEDAATLSITEAAGSFLISRG